MTPESLSPAYLKFTLSQSWIGFLIASLLCGVLPSVVVAQDLEDVQSSIDAPQLAQTGLTMSTYVTQAQNGVETADGPLTSGDGEINQTGIEESVDQADSPVTPDELREQLQIPPILSTSFPRFYYPGSGTGIPEGFGAEWGDVFITISGASKDRVRTTFIDSSISMGLGLGNPRELVGMELAYNILSTRTQLAVNGSFDLKVHRHIFEDNNFLASAALGVSNFYSYGPEASLNSSAVYGVVSGFTYLQPNNPDRPMPLTFTLGAGGSPIFAENGVGLIAGAGVEVHPQIGLGSSWNGTGFSLGASFVPFRNVPLTLSALYQDIFNMTVPGHKLILSLDYSYSFK